MLFTLRDIFICIKSRYGNFLEPWNRGTMEPNGEDKLTGQLSFFDFLLILGAPGIGLVIFYVIWTSAYPRAKNRGTMEPLNRGTTEPLNLGTMEPIIKK